MTGSEPVAVLRETLERYLEESSSDYSTDADGDFVVRHGSATIWIRPVEWGDGQTIVRIWSITNVGMHVDGALTRFLATQGGNFLFGGFRLDESRRAVLLGHTLLGDFLSRRELEEALAAVSETADAYDDLIKARFGGRLFSEPAVAIGARGSKRTLQAVFGLLGIVAGVLAAIAAYLWIDSSYALAVYAFLLVAFLVGRGIADVITDPHKARRALYFLLQPAIATAIVYGAYGLWGRWWLAVLLGFVGGAIVAGALGPVLFPRIHQEEQADTTQRFSEGLGS